jgi:hypothetical protein
MCFPFAGERFRAMYTYHDKRSEKHHDNDQTRSAIGALILDDFMLLFR